MAKMIQIRNVPESLHRQLKARAAQAGMTLSDYLLAELRRGLDRPSLPELRARLRTRQSVHAQEAPAEVLRRERDHL